MNKFLLFFALFIVLILGFLYFVFVSTSKQVSNTNNTVLVVDSGPKLISSASLVCNEGKIINASFFEETIVSPTDSGQVPTSFGTAIVTLDDGRTLNLKQAISADGGRYTNNGDVFVFWSKGNGALVLENGAEKTYRGCVKTSEVDPTVKLQSVFADLEGSFSIRLPSILSSTTLGYAIDETFTRIRNPNQTISGVIFTIPVAMATGTNLSKDSYISVEQIKNSTRCSGDLFLSGAQSTSSVTDSGVAYSLATSSEAGAGNLYEEVVYAVVGTNPCVAVHYFLHYTSIENYPTGRVTEFNKKAILNTFDQIRRTLVINQ